MAVQHLIYGFIRLFAGSVSFRVVGGGHFQFYPSKLNNHGGQQTVNSG